MSIDKLKEQLRSFQFQPGQVKTADLGGGQDSSFEQSFSNLAHSYLKDKAPKLMQYEVGFQLLSKDQDNTKAVGVFGFKVGSQWIYAPVFFLNGDLKGHELLYIKNQDSFVPLKEEWIDYILGKKPAVLGDGVNRNLSLLGVMPPNLYQLSRSPQKFASDQSRSSMPKMASWFREFLPKLSYLAYTPLDQEPKYDNMKNVGDLLKEAGEPLFQYLVGTVGQQYPGVIQTIDRMYGEDFLTKLAQDIAARKQRYASNSLTKSAQGAGCCSAGMKPTLHPNKPAKPKRLKGRVKSGSITESLIGPMEATPKRHKAISKEMVDHDPDIIHDLSADEKKTLLKERVVYRDTRDGKDVTIAYDTQGPMRLQNPDHTGIYHVLTRPDKFEKCLIIMGPYGSDQRKNFCTVVCLEGKKRYTNAYPPNVFVTAEYDLDAWHKWLKEQKDAESIPVSNTDSWKDRKRYILLGPTGQGTVPFQATEEYANDSDKDKIYDVHMEDYSHDTRPAYLPDLSPRRDYYDSGCCHGNDRIILTGQPGIKIRINRNDLMVPNGFKLIQVREDEEDEKRTEPLMLGNLLDVQIEVMRQTTPMKVVSDGKDVTVEENRMDKTSAVIYLFEEHGLRKEAAETIVETAMRLGKCECRLLYPVKEAAELPPYQPKSAPAPISQLASTDKAKSGRSMGRNNTGYMQANYSKKTRTAEAASNKAMHASKLDKQAADPGNDMIRGAPNAPPFPEPQTGYDPMSGGNIPTMQESEYNIPIPDMSASKTDRSIYYPQGPDPKSMQVAQDAARTGQKEIFDTAMLGGLLKAVRQDSMVDRYLGDLMKGLDRLGRILFIFYWHAEELEERYSKQDMPELEDSLRNSFEGLGDVVLFLKRKTVQSDPDEGADSELDDTANAH